MRRQGSREFSGWLAYERIEDEIWMRRLAMLLRAGPVPRSSDDDEEVIDTTKPEFAQQFQGFINTPGRQQPSIPRPMQSTQIIMG